MLLAAVVAACVMASAAAVLPEKTHYHPEDAENLFKEHIKNYQRSYTAEEHSKRFNIFKENLKMLNDLNKEYSQAFGITQFADLTTEELNSYLGFQPDFQAMEEKNREIMPLSISENMKTAPSSWDWREAGKVTPVKNQGGCPACAIFSAIANIEGQYAIKYNQSIAFSEQQCMDCIQGMGCKTTTQLAVYGGLAQRKGCMKEDDYPYVDKYERTCNEKDDKFVAKVSGGKLLKVDEESLVQMLYNIGPLAVAVDGSDNVWYHGGILHPTRCSSKYEAMNHAMTLVGYGEEKGVKYWILKDSYGLKQGEKGYIRLLRGVNACGITNYVSTAYLA